MKTRGWQAFLALALVGLGWIAARAQTSAPDFEIVVNAPTGQTTVECLRGCRLKWIARGLNPDSQPMQRFTFSCSAPQGCSSSRVGGWIAP